jgi:hypothetical protein
MKRRFPFDLSHIRRIEYTDSIVGGIHLREELIATLNNILKDTSDLPYTS